MGTRRGRACLVLCWLLYAGLFVPAEVGNKASLEERLLLGTKPGEQYGKDVPEQLHKVEVPGLGATLGVYAVHCLHFTGRHVERFGSIFSTRGTQLAVTVSPCAMGTPAHLSGWGQNSLCKAVPPPGGANEGGGIGRGLGLVKV